MSRLDEKSYLQVLDVIHNVREVTDPDDFGPAALSELARLIPSEVLSFNEVDPVAGRFSFVVEPSTFPIPAGSAEVLTKYASEHPLIQYVARTGDGSARRVSDVWTREQWHSSGIFREFYGPLGIEHQMSIGLPTPSPIVVGIALNRGDTDFSDRERSVLNLVRPHLAQSWRHAREHRRVRLLLNTASQALASTQIGVVVLSDPPHELTSGALIALYRYFGRPGRVDPLPSRVSRWVSGQRKLNAGDAQLSRPLSTTLDGRRLVLRFLPAADGHAESILLSEDLVQRGAVGLAAMGLTPREAEVLQVVATGASNAQVATQLHIAPSTVKAYLDNVYAKLGVSGRTQAAAVMLEMLGHHTPERQI
jgi:DNA-binding NarL/FixJ family response regulator